MFIQLLGNSKNWYKQIQDNLPGFSSAHEAFQVFSEAGTGRPRLFLEPNLEAFFLYLQVILLLR